MYVFESHSVLWTQSKKLTFFWIFLSVSTFSSVSAPFSVGLNLFTSSKVESKSRSMNWNVLVYLGIRHLQRQQSEMIIIMTAPIIIPEICQTRSPLKTSDSRKLLSWCSLLPVSFPVSPTIQLSNINYSGVRWSDFGRSFRTISSTYNFPLSHEPIPLVQSIHIMASLKANRLNYVKTIVSLPSHNNLSNMPLC